MLYTRNYRDISQVLSKYILERKLHTVNPRISSLGAYLLFGFLRGGLFKGGVIRGGLKTFLVVGHIPVGTFLLVNYFFNATNTSN